MTKEQRKRISEEVKRQIRVELDLLDTWAMQDDAVESGGITEDEGEIFRSMLRDKLDKMISALV